MNFWHFPSASFPLPRKHSLISVPFFSENYRAFSITSHARQVQASLQVAESGAEPAGSTSLPLQIAACGQQNCLEGASRSQVQMFPLCPDGDVLKVVQASGFGGSPVLRSSEATPAPHVRIGFPAGSVAAVSRTQAVPRQKVACV